VPVRNWFWPYTKTSGQGAWDTVSPMPDWHRLIAGHWSRGAPRPRAQVGHRLAGARPLCVLFYHGRIDQMHLVYTKRRARAHHHGKHDALYAFYIHQAVTTNFRVSFLLSTGMA